MILVLLKEIAVN